MTFPNDDVVSLTVTEDTLRDSVHGDVLVCQDCHLELVKVPHEPVIATTYRDYALGRYEACKRCHFANYAKTLDSVHYETLVEGNLDAPVCTDCHGAHSVRSPGSQPGEIAETCAQCHAEVSEAYLQSVHGQALSDDEALDVPTCTRCHGVHSIGTTDTAGFRLDIPILCGECHSDKELMAKYGLSTHVVRTYLQDFHGMTVSLTRSEGRDTGSFEAVCTDCHGTHDIVSVSDPSSPVLKVNLVETCRQCHPGATENFPSAWLSHYEPSLSHAPLVFTVRWFYIALIPVMVGGLLIHVILNLWSWATNRQEA